MNFSIILPLEAKVSMFLELSCTVSCQIVLQDDVLIWKGQ